MERLDQLFSGFIGEHSPGYVVGVRRSGQDVYQKAFGMANIEYGVENRLDTVFHLASVSKQFTTFCVTLLESEGKLSLDRPVQDYLPYVPQFSEVITVRHLLHHVSGLREHWDMFGLYGCTMEDVVQPRHLLNFLKNQKELSFTPGERYQYCNMAFLLLAELVETVSKMSLREFADARIFRPLNMTSSYFRDNHGEIAFSRAASYKKNPRSGEYEHYGLQFDIVGPTSVNSTVSDLQKWIDHLKQPSICPPDVVAKMFEPYVLNSGEVSNYLRGIRRVNYRGYSMLMHSGANSGFRTVVCILPELDIDIVILSNYMHSYPMQRAFQVIDIICESELTERERHTSYTESDRFAAIEEGVYYQNGFIKTTLSKQDGAVVLTHDGLKYNYLHVSGNEYACAHTGAYLYLVDDGFFYQPLGMEAERYIRLVSSRVSGELEFAGSYYSPELKTQYELFFEGDEMVLRHMRADDIRLKRVEDGTYIAICGGELAVKLHGGARPYFTVEKERSQGIRFLKAELPQL